MAQSTIQDVLTLKEVQIKWTKWAQAGRKRCIWGYLRPRSWAQRCTRIEEVCWKSSKDWKFISLTKSFSLSNHSAVRGTIKYSLASREHKRDSKLVIKAFAGEGETYVPGLFPENIQCERVKGSLVQAYPLPCERSWPPTAKLHFIFLAQRPLK